MTAPKKITHAQVMAALDALGLPARITTLTIDAQRSWQMVSWEEVAWDDARGGFVLDDFGEPMRVRHEVRVVSA